MRPWQIGTLWGMAMALLEAWIRQNPTLEFSGPLLFQMAAMGIGGCILFHLLDNLLDYVVRKEARK